MVQFPRIQNYFNRELIFVEYDSNIKQCSKASCAIKCQQLIMHDYGIDIPEKDLCNLAEEYGWYNIHEGVHMHDNGKLLGSFGIEYHHSQGNNLNDITNEIRQCHRIMVNVNSVKLSGAESCHMEACHSVILSGIDEKFVYITDPAHGCINKPYTIDIFMHAWSDSYYYLLATNISAPFEYDPISKTMKDTF